MCTPSCRPCIFGHGFSSRCCDTLVPSRVYDVFLFPCAPAELGHALSAHCRNHANPSNTYTSEKALKVSHPDRRFPFQARLWSSSGWLRDHSRQAPLPCLAFSKRSPNPDKPFVLGIIRLENPYYKPPVKWSTLSNILWRAS